MQPTSYRPHYCVWELTLACNLRCTHCGSRAGCARADELTTAECLDVVSQLADLGCRLITLSGGEPTLRDDWEAIARAAATRGVTVNMVSNGTTITDELAQRLAASPLANVGISIDGIQPCHDAVRGPGTFRRATRGLERLVAAGARTAILTHLDRSTADCLEETHQLAADLGASGWRVQLGKPMGRLDDNRERLIRPEDLLDILPRLARIKETSPIWVDVGDSIGYYGPHERQLRRTAWGEMQNCWSGCQAGRWAIGIESDGGVKGCLSLQASPNGCEGRDPFREGSVRERRLSDLWFDPNAFAFNRQQKIEDLTGSCRGCRHAAICRGGAKCVASAYTGALTEDPYCYWRVERLASRRTRLAKGLRRGAAGALFGLGVSACLGGCFTPVGAGEEEPTAAASEPKDAQTSAPPAPDSGTILPPKAGPDAAYDPCEHPCTTCDYGVLPSECNRPDAGAPDASARPCICTDYGILPGPDCCNPQPAVQDAGAPPDPCAGVCCQCDYGIIPPGCCE